MATKEQTEEERDRDAILNLAATRGIAWMLDEIASVVLLGGGENLRECFAEHAEPVGFEACDSLVRSLGAMADTAKQADAELAAVTS